MLTIVAVIWAASAAAKTVFSAYVARGCATSEMLAKSCCALDIGALWVVGAAARRRGTKTRERGARM
jgi:hypothetical protein